MTSRPDSIGAPPVGAIPWFQLGIMEMGKSKVIKGKAQVFTQSIHLVRAVNMVRWERSQLLRYQVEIHVMYATLSSSQRT